MNILIADDHELIREGFARIISDEYPTTQIEAASNGIEAEKMGRAKKWDIIISDIAMPGKTGLDVLKQLRAEGIKTPMLIVSIYPENLYGLRALKAGASGYISKDCQRSDFLQALKTILNGKKYIPTSLAEKLASRLDVDTSTEAHELLSDRELQILKLIASGQTVSEISNELSLSVATISTYRHRVLEKMNLKTNAELTYYAVYNHLV